MSDENQNGTGHDEQTLAFRSLTPDAIIVDGFDWDTVLVTRSGRTLTTIEQSFADIVFYAHEKLC